jgi:hypothetical protein
MITQRDMEIVNYLERYDFATLKQIQKIFFRHQQYSYHLARKRLLQIQNANYIIKPERDLATNRNVYIFKKDKIKTPSQHRLLILDVLAELKYMGVDVEHFEVEKHWIDDKDKKGVYSDAFAIFTMKGRRYHYFIEVQLSNSGHNLEKYDKLFETGIVQKFYSENGYDKEFYPKRVLLVSDREYAKDILLKHCQVIQLNTKLENFYNVFI